jgi:hypothetical protein
MGLKGNNNAILFDRCKNLRNLTVTLQITQDLITLGNNGFSLQLNCYPQTKPTVNGQPLKWIQYVIAVENNSVQWGIQYWSLVKGLGFSPAKNYSKFASASSNQVPAGSEMKIALLTNSSGNVTQATFSITYPGKKPASHTFKFPSKILCGIYGFQVDLVGPPSGTHTCKFKSGAGILTYGIKPGTLAVQNKNTCAIAGGNQLATGEQSNAKYGKPGPGSITGGNKPSSKVSQTVGNNPTIDVTQPEYVLSPTLYFNGKNFTPGPVNFYLGGMLEMSSKSRLLILEGKAASNGKFSLSTQVTANPYEEPGTSPNCFIEARTPSSSPTTSPYGSFIARSNTFFIDCALVNPGGP